MRRLLARVALAVVPARRSQPAATRTCRCASPTCTGTLTRGEEVTLLGVTGFPATHEPDHRTDHRIGRPR